MGTTVDEDKVSLQYNNTALELVTNVVDTLRATEFSTWTGYIICYAKSSEGCEMYLNKITFKH